MLDFAIPQNGDPEDWKQIISQSRLDIVEEYNLSLSEDGVVWIPGEDELIADPHRCCEQFIRLLKVRDAVRSAVTQARECGILPEACRPFLQELYNELGMTGSVP